MTFNMVVGVSISDTVGLLGFFTHNHLKGFQRDTRQIMFFPLLGPGFDVSEM